RLVDGAVAVRPVDVLQFAVADDRHQLILVPGRTFAAHHLLDLRADDGPDFLPVLPAASAEDGRMFLGSDRTGVGVVVEAGVLSTPEDEDRMLGGEQYAHCRAQALRPLVRFAQGGVLPGVGADEFTHHATAGEKNWLPVDGRHLALGSCSMWSMHII